MTSSISSLSQLLIASLLAISFVHCSPDRLMVADTVFDWRQKGVISPVSNEGRTGSAIAIVLAEGVESLHAIQNEDHLVILSRQEVADCCDFGYLDYRCIATIGGLCTAADYKPSGGKCDNLTCQAVGKITGAHFIEAKREDLMQQLILTTPLSAALDASKESFETYTAGIYSDPNCSTTVLDHVVQIVGFGTTNSSENYWILKNSWGSGWGENGYMRIARGQNMCGIANIVVVPLNRP